MRGTRETLEPTQNTPHAEERERHTTNGEIIITHKVIQEDRTSSHGGSVVDGQSLGRWWERWAA